MKQQEVDTVVRAYLAQLGRRYVPLALALVVFIVVVHFFPSTLPPTQLADAAGQPGPRTGAPAPARTPSPSAAPSPVVGLPPIPGGGLGSPTPSPSPTCAVAPAPLCGVLPSPLAQGASR
jgi:hypothetical protein